MRIAEVISFGDELVSGQRLDTNSQWISQQLSQLGIVTAFHSTVGDNLAQCRQVFEAAAQRSDLIICTGGLGPTADDLTREVIANTANVPLERKPEVVEHIRKMYRIRNREMPDSNLCQADFPAGAVVIDNPEGTAPGIDFTFSTSSKTRGECRTFALPGVPAELKQMWSETVRPALQEMVGAPSVILHRTLHVFGEGESKIESMLPDLVRRGRDPTTGITASAATITLRVSTAEKTESECDAKILPVLNTIKERLGDLVFGADGETLADVVVQKLNQTNQTLAVIDAGLQGEVAAAIATSDQARSVLRNAVLPDAESFQVYGQPIEPNNRADDNSMLQNAALRIKDEFNTDFTIAIGPIDRTPANVDSGKSTFEVAIIGADASGNTIDSTCQYTYRGHSSWRQQRAVKQVLNQLRLLIA